MGLVMVLVFLGALGLAFVSAGCAALFMDTSDAIATSFVMLSYLSGFVAVFALAVLLAHTAGLHVGFGGS